MSKNTKEAFDQKPLSQAGHPDNEDNLVGVGLLALLHPSQRALVHPDQRAQPEGERGGVHLCQLSTGDTQLRTGETVLLVTSYVETGEPLCQSS